MLISLLILLLFSNALTLRQDKSILFSRTVIIGLTLISIVSLNNLYIKPLGKGLGTYSGLFSVTSFSQTFDIFIFLVSAIILTLNAFFPRKTYVKERLSLYNIIYPKLTYKTDPRLNKNTEGFVYDKYAVSNKNSEQFNIIEYPLIIVFILCGAVFLISSADLVSIFLSIELQSYGLYILSTIYRDSELATGSGLTYFLLGGLSSCFILLGSALLYTNSGTTNLDNIYAITSVSKTHNMVDIASWYEPYYLHLSLIIMSVGLLFKVSAAPFHFWSPDVYDGIPTIVTTYVAIVPKISIFVFLLELVYYTEYSFFGFTWKNILLLSSMFSLIIGSLLGLVQSRIKRLLAYSTISHVGFILLALSINTAESIQSYIFYILQYSLSNLNAFMILSTIGFSFYLYASKDKEQNEKLTDQQNSPIQLTSQIKGYFYVNPFVAVSLTITLFSFVGIPPVMGFFAKQMVLSSALDSGYVFMAFIAILTSVIGAVYYLTLIKNMFFSKSDYAGLQSITESEQANNKNSIKYSVLGERNHFLSSSMNKGSILNNSNNASTVIPRGHYVTVNSCLSAIISVLTLLLILFIYVPTQWFNIVNILSLVMFKS